MHRTDSNTKWPFRVFYDKDLGVATPFSRKLRCNVNFIFINKKLYNYYRVSIMIMYQTSLA